MAIDEPSNIPSDYVISRVIEYADICRTTHPDSVESQLFFEEHKFLPMFQENALQHYQMIKDDLAELELRFGKSSQKEQKNKHGKDKGF